MAKPAPKPAPKPAESEALPHPLEAHLVSPDVALSDLADLLRHLEGAPRSQVPALVADGLKRIDAIRNSLG